MISLSCPHLTDKLKQGFSPSLGLNFRDSHRSGKRAKKGKEVEPKVSEDDAGEGWLPDQTRSLTVQPPESN